MTFRPTPQVPSSDVSSYHSLGVRRVINAAGRYTALGGSVMPPVVLQAMADAAGYHVDIEELQIAAGRRLAELTRNEAAHVTVGAAAGLVLSVLAATTGTDPVRIRSMAEGRLERPQVIVQRSHHMQYVPAIRLAGAEIIGAGNVLNTDPADIAGAITEDTVAVLHVAGAHLSRGSLPLDAVVRVAADYGVPVIVDAAAQLPPVENLWNFTAVRGADIAVFSGGKDLRGPQASGLIVGRADLVTAARLHGSPNQRLGRALKTGKEEIMGLVAAVERYMSLDHEARAKQWERIVDEWRGPLSLLPSVTAERDDLNEAGQPVPRLIIHWVGGPSAEELIAELADGDPRLAVAYVGQRSIGLTPDTVADDEVAPISEIISRHFLNGSGARA